MIETLLAFKEIVLGFVTIIGAALLYLKGKSIGKRQIKDKIATETLNTAIETNKVTKNVENNISSMSDNTIRDKLREYARKNNS